MQVFPHVNKNPVQPILVVGKNHNVIGISEIILHALFLFQPMVEICKIEICEILRKIVADWDTAFNRINDFVKKPKQPGILDFPADNLLQDVMVDAWVEMADVDFQAILCSGGVVIQNESNVLCAFVDSPVLDARICVRRENGNPYIFKVVHNGMMNDSVREIRQTRNQTFFRLKDFELVIFGCLESLILQTFMQGRKICFTVLVMDFDTIRTQLPLAGFFIRKTQVVDADYLVI